MANDLLSVKSHEPPFAPPKSKARLVDDQELVAMYEMDETLRGLSRDGRLRALRWLAARHAGSGVTLELEQREGA